MSKLPGRKKVERFPGILVRQIIMISMSITSLFPLYFVVVNAFKTQLEYYENKLGPPWGYTLENIKTVLVAKEVLRWVLNSGILTFGSVGLSTLIAALAAFAFAKMEFKGRRPLLNLIVSLMVLPPVVVVMPLFVVMAKLQLVNNYFGTILVYTGLLIPFSIYLLYNFFLTVPSEVIDAALMDGCSNLRLFTHIMLPLSVPSIATVVAVNAIWVWNELLVAVIFMQSNELKTLMVGLTVYKGRFFMNVPLIMSGLLIATIPMILLYVFTQRYLIHGMMAGALKG